MPRHARPVATFPLLAFVLLAFASTTPTHAATVILLPSGGLNQSVSFGSSGLVYNYASSGPGDATSLSAASTRSVLSTSIAKFDLAPVFAQYPGQYIESLTLSGNYAGYTLPGSIQPEMSLSANILVTISGTAAATPDDFFAPRLVVGTISGTPGNPAPLPFSDQLSGIVPPVFGPSTALAFTIYPPGGPPLFLLQATNLRLTVTTAAVPEPASLASVAIGVGMVGAAGANRGWARQGMAGRNTA